MTKRRIAYVRTSPADGPDDLHQLAWVSAAATFRDHAPLSDHRRPQRRAALGAVGRGDTLVVQSMERLAHEVGELRAILESLNDRGVAVEFVSEALTFTPQDRISLQRELALLSAGEALAKAAIKERQRVGINKATQQKRKYNGAPLKLDKGQIARLHAALGQGISVTAIAKELSISRETVYRYERAGAALAVSAAASARAERQARAGETEKAARTKTDAVVKRRTAIAATKGLSIAEVRQLKAAAVAERLAVDREPREQSDGAA